MPAPATVTTPASVRDGCRPDISRLLQRRKRLDRRARPPRGLPVGQVHRDQAVRLSERQRLECDRVQDGEARRHRPDAEGERDNDNQDKAWTSAKLPYRNAKILGESAHAHVGSATSVPNVPGNSPCIEADFVFRCAVVGNRRSRPNSRHVPYDVATRDSGLGSRIQNQVWRTRRKKRVDDEPRSAQLQVSRATSPTSSSFCCCSA